MQTANMLAILQATSVNGVLAIAATLVIITGGIDLSVGTLMTFCAVIAGVVLTYLGLPLPLGVAGAHPRRRRCGAGLGHLHRQAQGAALHRHARHDADLKGLSLVDLAAPSRSISTTRPASPRSRTGSLIGDVIPGLPIPNGVLILFLVALVAAFVLARTVLGRYTFALGTNEEAVRLSGVNIDRWKIAVYALAGGICGVAGLLIASRLNSAQPALGQGYELDAIAAVVIGGTSLAGGRGTMLGTLIGALIICVLANGLRILSVPRNGRPWSPARSSSSPSMPTSCGAAAL